MQHLFVQRSIFVTGTDTGVGKTRVTRALVAALRRRGRRVAAMKPIETGCAVDGARLVPDDGSALAAACGRDLDLVCPERFATPASPAAAAAREGRAVDHAAIERAYQALAADADLLFVEGAGGLLVPIDDATNMADLAARFTAHLLIVARASLGTVNHTLLTVEAARRRGLAVAGVILNRVVAERGPDEDSNADAIARLGEVAVLGTLPHRAHADDETLAADAAGHLALPRIEALVPVR